MDAILKHPFVLLIAGVVFTGLIIPLVTRNWQRRQKAMDIKTALVSDISQAAMEFFMSIQFVHMRKEIRTAEASTSLQEQIDFDRAYKCWEIKSAIIGTKLQAYLSKSDIPGTWTAFSEIVTRFYALEGTHEAHYTGSISALKKLIEDTFSVDLPDPPTWMHLREAILQSKSNVIRAVLMANVSLG